MTWHRTMRDELVKARRFARRLKDEEHDDPAPPPLPPARVVNVPGRGEMFVRMTDGAGPGPPVVLLHGWTLSADLNWFSGVYEVAARYGPVVAPDLRGHGRGLRSDKPLTLEAMCDDVAALLDHVGLGAAVLVGYSMGGSIALLTWRHHRDRVAGLVLMSTALEWRTRLRERVIWSSMAAVEYGYRLGTPEGGMADRYLRSAVEQSPGLERYKSWVKAEIRRGDPSDIAAAGRGLSAFDAHDFAREVDVPTSVVVTARDRLIRAERQRDLGEAIPGAHLVEVDGGHNAWLVKPDEFSTAVDDALRHVLAAAAPGTVEAAEAEGTGADDDPTAAEGPVATETTPSERAPAASAAGGQDTGRGPGAGGRRAGPGRLARRLRRAGVNGRPGLAGGDGRAGRPGRLARRLRRDGVNGRPGLAGGDGRAARRGDGGRAGPGGRVMGGGGRRIAAAGGVGLAGAYAWAAAKYRREEADSLDAEDVPPAGSPEFARILETLTLAPVRPGSRVRILRNGVETFPAMLEAIASAERTIDFSSYIYWPGEITEQFTEAFVEWARAGVEVNVVLDGYGSARLGRDHVRRLEDGGVRVKFFRVPRWHTIASVNNRMHRRLLVVDGTVGFAGGVGIADVWTGDAEDPEHWRETHARFEGPVVRDILGGFLESWVEASREVLAGPRYPELEPFEDGIPAQVTRSSPLTGDSAVAQLFLLSLAAARERVWLTTAYFTAGRRFLDALCEAARRGVDVRILVNGRQVDKEVVRKSAQHLYGRLLESGVRIYEYDRTMLHAKTTVVDDDWSTFGSSNSDHRSFGLDAELNVSLYDADATGELADHFLEDLKEARELDLDEWRSRPLRTRALEAAGELARQSF